MSLPPLPLLPSVLLALLAAASTLPSVALARSFVALDRSTSCVQQFGCSADFVGFIMEVRACQLQLKTNAEADSTRETEPESVLRDRDVQARFAYAARP
jgi:hypothetical protein